MVNYKERPPYRRTSRASVGLRDALVGGMPASNRACRVVPTETRRHSLHKYKPSCGADAESPACGISGKGRGLNPSAAHGSQYSVATSFYQLDCKLNSRLRSACSRRPPSGQRRRSGNSVP
jgi:hypothetical protein